MKASPDCGVSEEELGRCIEGYVRERLRGRVYSYHDAVYEAAVIMASAALYEAVRRRNDGLEPLSELLESRGGVSGLAEALRRVRGKAPRALSVASRILEATPGHLDTLVYRLALLGVRASEYGASCLLRLIGRLSHKLSAELRKGYATYYTEEPSAFLLARLALRAYLDGGGLSSEGAIRVADFACGAGVLLYAVQEALPQELGTGLGVKLYCVEAMEYASAVAELLLYLSPSGPGVVGGIHTEPLGVDPGRGDARLGSLEYLDWDPWGSGGFDVVIMNPPFTRATGRGGSGAGLFGFVGDEGARRRILGRYRRLRERVRRELLDIALEELGSRLSGAPDELRKALRGEGGLAPLRGIGHAGEGLLFLYLAYKRLREGGVLAFVLPKALLSGSSWLLARALLASRLSLRYVVTSSDRLGGYGFSEGSSLSEVLVVAVKGDGQRDAVFIDLHRKPSSPAEALALADAIDSTVRAMHSRGLRHAVVEAGRCRAVLLRVGRGGLVRSMINWGVYTLPHPELVDVALGLGEGYIVIPGYRRLGIPVAPLGLVAESIGVDRHQFRDHFRVTRDPTGYPVLYGGGENVRRRMAVEPNAYAEPLRERSRILYERYSARVLVPDRIRWNTAHVTAMLSSRPVLSNMHYAVRIGGPERRRSSMEKALVLWLNSAWGIAALLSRSCDTEGAWSQVKASQWRALPVLDVRRLGESVLAQLARVYDEFSGRELGRIPEQLATGSRLELDLKILKALHPEIEPGRASQGLSRVYRLLHDTLKPRT